MATEVHIYRSASRKAAEQLGREATRHYARQIAMKARVLAAARIKSKKHPPYVLVEQGDMPQDTRVVLRIPPRRDKKRIQVGMSLEQGYVSALTGKHVEGKHILRDAVFS